MSDSMPIIAPRPHRQKGIALVAWIVILLSVGVILGARYWMEQTAAETLDTGSSRSRAVILELQSRYVIGLHHFLGPFAQGLDAEVEKMNRGGVDQRLRVIVLLGEIVGAREALRRLDELDALCKKHGVALTVTQDRARSVLRSAYRDFENGKLDAPSINEAERAFLVEELGWFGTLALNPKPREGPPLAGRTEAMRPAEITVIAMFSALALGGLFLCIGFAGGITFAVMAWNRSITWRFDVGVPHGNVYAETFALWLVCFFGWNVALSLLPIEIPRIMQGNVVMLASLAVLAWPIARGIPWQRVREDIGLTCPGNPLTEVAAGVWCYIVNLPLVALGFAMTVGMLLLHAKLTMPEEGNVENFSSESLPSHPVLQFLADGDWPMRAQIFVLACIVAPLVEEIMFRGVLHRHCRELTGAWRPLVSALFSTTVVSFLFAAVHPQGLMVIPPLMFMAFGFSLVREWRASLLGSMFAHGMSNGMVLTVTTIALWK